MRWWRQLDASVECPISFESLNSLAHAPFDLPVKAGVPCYFEPAALAAYLVSKLVFQHPLSRAPLQRDALLALDAHLRASGMAAATVEAFDLHARCAAPRHRRATEGDDGDRRRDALQREAAKVMRHLFAHRDAERRAQRERREGDACGVIDDDVAVGLRGGAAAACAESHEEDAGDEAFEDAFPTLAGDHGQVSRPSIPAGSFAWTSAAAVAAPANFPPLPTPAPRSASSLTRKAASVRRGRTKAAPPKPPRAAWPQQPTGTVAYCKWARAA